MSEFSLTLKKEFSVPAEVVFDAWLDPSSIKEWMCPADGVTVPSPEVDAKVGGKYLFNRKGNYFLDYELILFEVKSSL